MKQKLSLITLDDWLLWPIMIQFIFSFIIEKYIIHFDDTQFTLTIDLYLSAKASGY